MPGAYNGEGVNMDTFVLIPVGEYTLRVIEAVQGLTKNNDDMVTVTFEVVGGDFNLEKVPYYRVIFFADRMKKGAGIALTFLKSIGEPFEGQFKWNEKNWIGKKLKATIKHEVATQGKSVGKTFAKVAWVDLIEGAQAETDVPF